MENEEIFFIAFYEAGIILILKFKNYKKGNLQENLMIIYVKINRYTESNIAAVKISRYYQRCFIWFMIERKIFFLDML